MPRPKITFAGGGERAQYLTHKGNDTTIRFVLNYPGLIDPDVMRAATKAVVESVDVLHSTFFTDINLAYWKVNNDVEESNYFHYIRTEGDPAATAFSLSLLPVYHEGKAQLRCELVQSDCASSLVVSISHLCVDGGDGKYLLNKLVEAYNLILESGNADALEVKNGSRAPEKVYENKEFKDLKGMLKMPIAKAYGAMPVGLTNLGNMKCASLALGGLVPTGGVFGGPLKKKPGFQISIISFDGECVLACYGQYTAGDEAHIAATLSGIRRVIEAYAAE